MLLLKILERFLTSSSYSDQLICTITPASSNFEETHNTLKFASRAKRVEIYASCNRVSLIMPILGLMILIPKLIW